MNQLFLSINRFVLRLLLFPHNTRKYFFTLMQEYNASNFALIDTLQHMERMGDNPTIKKIARHARSNVRNQLCFAKNLSKTGFFTPIEEKLLILGEEHKSMDNVIHIIMRADKFRAVPITLLKDSFQWIFMTLIIVWLANNSSNTMRRIAGDMEWFFDITAQLSALFMPSLVFSLAFALLYNIIRRSPSPLRRLLRSTGLFSLHDQITEHRLLQVAGELSATNIPANDLLNILADIFSNERWLTKRIKHAQRRLREESLFEVLNSFISKHTYLHIIASAPNQQPDEISRGMNSAANVLELQISQRISLLRLLTTMATLTLAAAATIPFILITMGMTAQMKL